MKSKELKERIKAGAAVCIPIGYTTPGGNKEWLYVGIDPEDILKEIRRHPNVDWDVEPMDPEAGMGWTVWVYGFRP